MPLITSDIEEIKSMKFHFTYSFNAFQFHTCSNPMTSLTLCRCRDLHVSIGNNWRPRIMEFRHYGQRCLTIFIGVLFSVQWPHGLESKCSYQICLQKYNIDKNFISFSTIIAIGVVRKRIFHRCKRNLVFNSPEYGMQHAGRLQLLKSTLVMCNACLAVFSVKSL